MQSALEAQQVLRWLMIVRWIAQAFWYYFRANTFLHKYSGVGVP